MRCIRLPPGVGREAGESPPVVFEGDAIVSSIFGNTKTGNPAFRAASGTIFDDWAHADRRVSTMTVAGTAYKALALLVVLTICAAISWSQVENGTISRGLLVGSMIVGMVVALATIFRPTWAPYTSPLYAAAEGFFLGAISNIFEKMYGQGIAFQAVGLTFATLFVMLVLYSTRTIRVTDQLTRIIVGATGAVALVYIVSMLLNMFGMHVPYIHSSGPIGIGFSVFVVGLAAFNLLLDFDFIETQSRRGAPKSMEWYGAFGLMVTLIWLYLEILRLLAKLQSNRD